MVPVSRMQLAGVVSVNVGRHDCWNDPQLPHGSMMNSKTRAENFLRSIGWIVGGTVVSLFIAAGWFLILAHQLREQPNVATLLLAFYLAA